MPTKIKRVALTDAPIEHVEGQLSGNPITSPKRLVVLCRAYLDLTQKQFADVIGVARETVNRWESGKQPIDRLPLMCLKYYLMLYSNKKLRKPHK